MSAPTFSIVKTPSPGQSYSSAIEPVHSYSSDRIAIKAPAEAALAGADGAVAGQAWQT